MNTPGIIPPEPALVYLKNFKIRMLNRLFGEQVDALSRADKLSERERNEYQTRKLRILKLEQELGIAPPDNNQN